MYSNDVWTAASLSTVANSSLTNSTTNHDDEHHHHHRQQTLASQQMITLKPVCNEPMSPSPGLLHDTDLNKTVTTIHRPPMLIACTDPRASSPTGPTHFRCTQCQETFDSLLLGQEHANNGMCISDATINVNKIHRFRFLKYKFWS